MYVPTDARRQLTKLFHSHTDISSLCNDIPCVFPCILGHEGAGYVEYVAPNYAGKFKKGDVVIASFCSCGDCVNCQGNMPARCDLFMATSKLQTAGDAACRH